MEAPVPVGVIGVGRFGEHHARAFAESTLSQLVAVVDVDPDRAAAVADRYGAQRYYTDYHDLLNDPTIQAVSIATPAHLHAGVAMLTACAGKHILLEKPIATTLKDAEAIVNAAQRHHVRLMMGHMLRFETNFAAIQSAIEAGGMGKPVTLVGRFNNSIAEARYSGASISPILHVMIHLIDLALWYLGTAPLRVFCAAARGKVDEERGVPDGCVATIEFEGGGLAVLESFWCLPEAVAGWEAPRTWAARVSDVQVEVICTEGVLYLDSAITSLRACDREGWKFPQTTFRPEIHGELGGALREEIAHFLKCCRNGSDPIAAGEAGLASLKVALAAEASLVTRMPVAVA